VFSIFDPKIEEKIQRVSASFDKSDDALKRGIGKNSRSDRFGVVAFTLRLAHTSVAYEICCG
jgi:hypothetical protein